MSDYNSIYFYKRGDFKNFIQSIEDESTTVENALGAFREIRTLARNFKHMTIEALKNNYKLIAELRLALRNGMAPEANFKLSYKKEERIQELIEKISQHNSINKDRAKGKIVTRHYKDENTEQEFNYCLEVLIAPLINSGFRAGHVEILGNINSTPGEYGGESYFEGEDGTYIWMNRNDIALSSRSLREILAECGFTVSKEVSIARRRYPSLLYINLLTPITDWLGGKGKTHINLSPYARDIADTVSYLAYKMPSYYGQGHGWPTVSYGTSREDNAIYFLRKFLQERYNAIKQNPDLRDTDRLTQSGVWYRIRPKLIDSGYEPKNWGETRKYITGEIPDVCDELSKKYREIITREDLGIIASPRAVMLYNGQDYPVTHGRIRELSRQGVGIIVIEKSGIADTLRKHAEECGIALVQTQGRFVDYVKDLIELAKVATSPIATLTDYDADGISMANETITVTPRIGINMETLEWLRQNGYPDLKQEDLEEEYKPHMTTDDEYLLTHRIELDSIVAVLGGEALWKYCKYRFELIAKENGFDYSKIIEHPDLEDLYPDEISNFLSKLNTYVQNKVRPKWEDIVKNQLKGAKELISIEGQEESNIDSLSKIK